MGVLVGVWGVCCGCVGLHRDDHSHSTRKFTNLTIPEPAALLGESLVMLILGAGS